MPSTENTNALTEEQTQEQEIQERSSPSSKILHAAILREADEELSRPSGALFWSGLAAGLSMGFSLCTEGLLRHFLPHAHWTPLIAKLGYTTGFLIVILGRQQLFTENTLTPILALLQRKDRRTFVATLRLWTVVLAANLIGAIAVSGVALKTRAFDPEVQRQFVEMGREAMAHGFATLLLRGIFAGWLIALLVWMMPFAESSHFFVIIFIAWVIGIGHFSHVIAGAVEVFGLAWSGAAGWVQVLGGFVAPALLGNIIGGIVLVAAFSHGQVQAGE